MDARHHLCARGTHASPVLLDVKSGCRKPLNCRRHPREQSMEWAGHTRAWTLATGAKVWLRTTAKRQIFPPVGIDLPIILGDETVISSQVVSSSVTRIVIELDSGHLRCLTLGASGLSPRGFPGSEWIVQLRV